MEKIPKLIPTPVQEGNFLRALDKAEEKLKKEEIEAEELEEKNPEKD